MISQPLHRRWSSAGVSLTVASAALVAVLVVLRATRSEAALELWLARLLFWAMPPVLLFVLVGAVAGLKSSERSFLAGLRWLAPGALGCSALVVILFVCVPPQMRVQFDETSIVGSSQSMLQHEACLVTMGALPVDGQVFPRENTVDKRPPLFAFLVHLVHRVAGFRIANAFWVNGCLLVLGMLAAFQYVRKRLGIVAAFAAPLCLLSVPLVGVAATSAGFDQMAAVWLVVALAAASEFVAAPERGRFCWLLAALMLLAQSRYESLPVALLLGACVWWRVRGRYRPDRVAVVMMAAAPVLLTPIALLLLHAQNPKFYPESGGAPLLGIAHFVDHLWPLMTEWFSLGLTNVYPGVLAIVGLGVFSVWLFRGERRRDDLIIGGVGLVPALIALAWFFGDAREQTAARLFLPLAWLTALMPVFVFRWAKGKVAVACVLVLATWCGLRVREVAMGRAFPQMPIATVLADLDVILAQIGQRRSTTLWVGLPAQYLIVRGYAALTAHGFLRRGDDLRDLAGRGDLREVYFLTTTVDGQLAESLGDVADVLPAVSVALDRVQGSISVHRMLR